MLQERDLRELRNLCCDVLFLQVQLKLLKFQRIVTRFNPGQPRVPAGSPEGGEWTNGSLIHPANERIGRFKNDLIIHEGLGKGHAIKQHVGKSDFYLMQRVREFQNEFRSGDYAAGTFANLESANKLVNSVIDMNETEVASVASGCQGRCHVC